MTHTKTEPQPVTVPDTDAVVGHDGRRYPCRTVQMVDLHLRNITARIRGCRNPRLRAALVEDRDLLLDRRSDLLPSPECLAQLPDR